MTIFRKIPKYYVPNTILCGLCKTNTNEKIITLKRAYGSYIFPAMFKSVTGYDAVDNPRDSIVKFERDATNSVYYTDNNPIENLKILDIGLFNNDHHIWIEDPRGWKVHIPSNDFLKLITECNITISNHHLIGKYVYAIKDGISFAVIPANHIVDVVTQNQIEEQRKQLKSRKLTLIPGKVYDCYVNKSISRHRKLYLGKLGNIFGERAIERHFYKCITLKEFDRVNHVWLDLNIDRLDTMRRHLPYWASLVIPENKQQFVIHNISRKSDSNELFATPNKIMPGIDIEGVKFGTYLDHFSKKTHNFEFSPYCIETSSVIDKCLICGESENQSYEPTYSSLARRNMILKNDKDMYPVKWTLDEIIEACKKFSIHLYNCNINAYNK